MVVLASGLRRVLSGYGMLGRGCFDKIDHSPFEFHPLCDVSPDVSMVGLIWRRHHREYGMQGLDVSKLHFTAI